MLKKRPASDKIDESKEKRGKFEERLANTFTVLYDESRRRHLCLAAEIIQYLKESKEPISTFQIMQKYIADHQIDQSFLPVKFAFQVLRQIQNKPSSLFDLLFELHHRAGRSETDICGACKTAMRKRSTSHVLDRVEAAKLNKWHGRNDFLPYVSCVHESCLLEPPSDYAPLKMKVYCHKHSSVIRCTHPLELDAKCAICTTETVQYCARCVDKLAIRCEECTIKYCPTCQAPPMHEKDEKDEDDPFASDDDDAPLTSLFAKKENKQAKQDEKKESTNPSRYLMYEATDRLREWYQQAMSNLVNPDVEVLEALHPEFSNAFFWTRGSGGKPATNELDRNNMLVEIVKHHLAAEKENRNVNPLWTGIHKLKKVPVGPDDPRTNMRTNHFKIIASDSFEAGEFVALYSGILGLESDFNMKDPADRDYSYRCNVSIDDERVVICAHYDYGNISKFMNDYHLKSANLSESDELKRLNCVATVFCVNGIPFVAFSAKRRIASGDEFLLNYDDVDPKAVPEFSQPSAPPKTKKKTKRSPYVYD